MASSSSVPPQLPVELPVKLRDGSSETVLCFAGAIHSASTESTDECHYSVAMEVVTSDGKLLSGRIFIVGVSDEQRFERANQVLDVCQGRSSDTSLSFEIQWDLDPSFAHANLAFVQNLVADGTGSSAAGRAILTGTRTSIGLRGKSLPSVWRDWDGLLHAPPSLSCLSWDPSLDRGVSTLQTKAEALLKAVPDWGRALAGKLREAARAGQEKDRQIEAARAAAAKAATQCQGLRGELETAHKDFSKGKATTLARFVTFVNGKKKEIRALQFDVRQCSEQLSRLESEAARLRVRATNAERDLQDFRAGEGPALRGGHAQSRSAAGGATGSSSRPTAASVSAPALGRGRRVVDDDDGEQSSEGTGGGEKGQGVDLDGRDSLESEEEEERVGSGEPFPFAELDERGETSEDEPLALTALSHAAFGPPKPTQAMDVEEGGEVPYI